MVALVLADHLLRQQGQCSLQVGRQPHLQAWSLAWRRHRRVAHRPCGRTRSAGSPVRRRIRPAGGGQRRRGQKLLLPLRLPALPQHPEQPLPAIRRAGEAQLKRSEFREQPVDGHLRRPAGEKTMRAWLASSWRLRRERAIQPHARTTTVIRPGRSWPRRCPGWPLGAKTWGRVLQQGSQGRTGPQQQNCTLLWRIYGKLPWPKIPYNCACMDSLPPPLGIAGQVSPWSCSGRGGRLPPAGPRPWFRG